jgi:hypothetical protein
MAWRDPSTIDFENGLADFFFYINEVTLGWASRLILIGIYIIVLSGYYKARDDFVGGVAAAGVATFVAAFGLFMWGFVDWITFGIVIAMMFVGAAVVLIDRNSNTV